MKTKKLFKKLNKAFTKTDKFNINVKRRTKQAK